jgi:hypothetical protein
MASPFPGMDPYLEGFLWPDVHNALASKLRQMLAPRVRPRYVVRLAIYVVEDMAPEGEIGIMYPDVEILGAGQSAHPETVTIVGTPLAVSPAIMVPVLPAIEVRVPVIEIRDAVANHLVTAIEILSPVNKREPGLGIYRQKRRQLIQAGVHLVEIDLIRRGVRPLAYSWLPATAYLVTLLRAQANQLAAWPVRLSDPLPTIPIPLQAPDADVPLDLQAALTAIYDEAGYDLSIDYAKAPPPPVLPSQEERWT